MSRLAHLRYRRYLDAHVDSELTSPVGGRVAAHVDRCPVCRQDAHVTAHMKESLARWRGLTDGAADRIRGCVHRDLGREPGW